MQCWLNLLPSLPLYAQQVFNILCEHPETVAAFLVPRARSVVARGDRGAAIRYLTPARVLSKLLAAPLRAGRYFDSNGEGPPAGDARNALGRVCRFTFSGWQHTYAWHGRSCLHHHHPSGISATAGEAVYPPERQRILGERAKRTQRLQRAAARRGAPLRLAYSLAMAGCFLMMAASGAVAGGP